MNRTTFIVNYATITPGSENRWVRFVELELFVFTSQTYDDLCRNIITILENIWGAGTEILLYSTKDVEKGVKVYN